MLLVEGQVSSLEVMLDPLRYILIKTPYLALSSSVHHGKRIVLSCCLREGFTIAT